MTSINECRACADTGLVLEKRVLLKSFSGSPEISWGSHMGPCSHVFFVVLKPNADCAARICIVSQALDPISK